MKIELIKKIVIRKVLSITSNHTLKAKMLRLEGVKIGKGCQIDTTAFGNERYLIKIGNKVALGTGTRFANHDGAVSIFRDEYPNLRVFGTIIVGDNTFIGVNCTILYDTCIGANCVIAAGSVVKGEFPNGSVIMGNPAKVVMKTSLFKVMAINNKGRLDLPSMPEKERAKIIKDYFGIV